MQVHIENLSKKYRHKEVLNIPQLQIPSGQIFGLLGNNGAGKTTLFRLMLDLIKANSGHVEYNGSDTVTSTQDWKNYTGAFLDNDFLIDFYTPEEYFELVAGLHAMTTTQIIEKLDLFDSFFNHEILNTGKLIRELSSGNKHKVGIAAALLHEPKIVILDEPFNMIDPSSKHKLDKLLKTFNQTHGATILVSSNILEPIIQCSDRIVLLEKGQVIKDKTVTPEYIKEINDYFTGD